MPERGNQKGNQISNPLPLVGKGGGARILLSWFQNWLISKVNSNTLKSIAVPIGDSTTSGGMRFADIKITPDGTVVTLPAQNFSSGGNGGGNNPFVDFYDNAVAYESGSIVQVLTVTTIGTGGNAVTILPGTYALRDGLTVPAGAPGSGGVTTNMIPQFPYPTAPDANGVTIYWICIAMGVITSSVCSGGTTQSIYVNSSDAF